MAIDYRQHYSFLTFSQLTLLWLFTIKAYWTCDDPLPNAPSTSSFEPSSVFEITIVSLPFSFAQQGCAYDLLFINGFVSLFPSCSSLLLVLFFLILCSRVLVYPREDRYVSYLNLIFKRPSLPVVSNLFHKLLDFTIS